MTSARLTHEEHPKLVLWDSLEGQSEVSQKDKDQYSILTHIYGI